MRALVKYASGPGNVELRDVPAPTLAPGTVLLDVDAVAVCGTDRAAIEGGHDFRVPRILGHEVAGTVAEIGAGADRPDLAVGDRVTVETDAYLCMRCAYCRAEQYNRCPHRLGIGTTTDGGLAEQLVMPSRALHALPENVSQVVGALTEPTAVAVHGVVEQSPSLAGEVVVVVGPGAVGMLTAQVARAVGATVVLVGRARHADKLAAASRTGIQHAVDADTTDLPELVSRLTGGYGAHSVFECSGGEGVIESLPPLLRRGGRIVLLAFYRTPPTLDIDRVTNHELEVVGSRGKRASSFRTALRLMASGAVDPGAVVEEVLPLEEWERGMELVGRGAKVVLQVR
ncbi:zinc-binding dehydrogenase [Georgenia sp. Z1491]|uniref:zinc-binding dehydrogenase n=1 Tax=Georgenia sp. Z1491 TaxID=3416707 RepID=UPI003CF3977A